MKGQPRTLLRCERVVRADPADLALAADKIHRI